MINKPAFIDWIKKQQYVGKGFIEDEQEMVHRLYGTLDRFRQYLQDKYKVNSIEDTSLEMLKEFDFNYPENDDQNLRLAFSFLGKKELVEYMGLVSADKYFRNKKLAVMLKAMDELKGYVPDLRTVNIRMASELLEQGATPEGRAKLEESTGIPAKEILKLVHCCDLCRMIGMAGQTLRRANAMDYDTLEKFRSTTPEQVEIEYNAFLHDNGERSNRMVHFPSFVHQARKLKDVIVYE